MTNERERIARVVQGIVGEHAHGLDLRRRPLLGGLEAAAVELIGARYRDARGRPRVIHMVAKRVSGAARREAAVYERLLATRVAPAPAPRLLAVDAPSRGTLVLYLEAVRRASAWPWREVTTSRALLQRMATFHLASADARRAVPAWDYEAELIESARATLELLEELRREPEFSLMLRRSVPAARRFVHGLPRVREQLLGYAPLHSGPIHGDVHTGNALLRMRGSRPEPILIDWGRARIGSPLEDVSSWLQSLGTWEPEARRRHDSLLAGYLSERGLSRKLPSHLRSVYAFAGASNALAGALRHHLLTAAGAPRSRERARAAHSALTWLRVIRQAAAAWS